MRNEELYKKIKKNWDNLAKPIDGLGEYENILSKIGAVQGDESIALSPATLLVFIADNGIIEEGVSQSGSEVTYEVAKALGMGMSTVNHMARSCGINVVPVNVGIKHPGEIKGVENKCVINGTRNFKEEPAMTIDEVENALDIGRECVRQLKSEGTKIIALGEMGIGNTTTSAAVLAGLLNLNGEEVCSKGAGLSNDSLQKKIKIVDQAKEKYNLSELSPLEILRYVGGLDLAALVGAILEANEQNLPVISDGFITGVAALTAYYIEPSARDIIFFSHAGRESGMHYIFDVFEVSPVITADMALGEGTGACIFLASLKCAHSVYSGNTQFSDINIDNYERFQ